MDEQCVHKVWDNSSILGRLRQCSRNAKLDGFCNQHHPTNVKKRAEARQIRCAQEQEHSPYARLDRANKELTTLRETKTELVDCIHALIEGSGPECVPQWVLDMMEP